METITQTPVRPTDQASKQILDGFRKTLITEPGPNPTDHLSRMDEWYQTVSGILSDPNNLEPVHKAPANEATEVYQILHERKGIVQGAMKMDPCQQSLWTGLAAITAGAIVGGPVGAVGGFVVACAQTYASCA